MQHCFRFLRNQTGFSQSFLYSRPLSVKQIIISTFYSNFPDTYFNRWSNETNCKRTL